jgi:hypothetical protein
VPILVIEDADWKLRQTSARGSKCNRPDAVISHEEAVLDWLRGLGGRVPNDVGFVHLNCPDESGTFAGIYQNGPSIGSVAVDFLIGMIHRNERGIPGLAHAILVEGTWVEGQTVRALAADITERDPIATRGTI